MPHGKQVSPPNAAWPDSFEVESRKAGDEAASVRVVEYGSQVEVQSREIDAATVLLHLSDMTSELQQAARIAPKAGMGALRGGVRKLGRPGWCGEGAAGGAGGLRRTGSAGSMSVRVLESPTWRGGFGRTASTSSHVTTTGSLQGAPDSEAGDQAWYEAADFHFYDSRSAALNQGLSSPMLRNFLGGQKSPDAFKSGSSTAFQRRLVGPASREEKLREMAERQREILGLADGGSGEGSSRDASSSRNVGVYVDEGNASSHSPGSGPDAVALAQVRQRLL